MKIIKSPNFNDRPNGAESIDSIVMHYTGMKTANDALKKLCDPAFEVSAHYMIYENGEVVNLVPDEKRAWHAGISCWRGKAGINDGSIGIEIVNKGHEFGYEPFPKVQINSVISLTKDLLSKYNIQPRNIIGHSDISPSRKEDPGELFPWEELSLNNIGLWPKVKVLWKKNKILVNAGSEGVSVADVQSRLQKFGYHIRVDGNYGSKMEDVVIAFKRHFVPENLTPDWDKLSDARLNRLLELIYSKSP